MAAFCQKRPIGESMSSVSLPPGTLESLQRINTDFLRCVVPLFWMKRGVAIHAGCGFFIDDGSRQYLVSAPHVLEQTHQGTLFFGIEGRQYRSIVEPQMLTGGKGLHDTLDIGVVRVPDLRLRPPAAPVSISMLGPNRRDGDLYTFGGFPSSKGGRKASRAELVYQSYCYAGVPAMPGAYVAVGVSESTHHLITFNKRSIAKGVGSEPSIQTFPDLKGMSGSPVWLLANGPPPRPVLVGVLTRWMKREHVIVATDIGVVLEAI